MGFIYMKSCSEDIFLDVRTCSICAERLPLAPRPIVQGSKKSTILIIGQAPGIKAHDSQKPWNDASGERLRAWLGIGESLFYDQSKVALIPMGFCYPGKGKSGDLPPRPECAPKWHDRLITKMPVNITFLIGQYAQNYYLNDKLPLTERVKNWQEYQPQYFVLPHPSPRNNIWLKRHPWFEKDVIPAIQNRVRKIIG